MNLEPKNLMWGTITFVVVILGLWGAWKLTTVPAGSETASEIQITAEDHVKGAENGTVTLVEYSDLQCPACKSFAPLVSQLIEQNSDTVRFVYKHFPLSQHEFASEAAYAAEAAGLQGKFYEYHDILFAQQDTWSAEGDVEKSFLAYAEELELDLEQFKKDMASDNVKTKVEKDQLSGVAAGVDSTPSFYLNGKKLRTPGTLEEFQGLIDQELALVGAPAKEETPTEADKSDTEEDSMEPSDDASKQTETSE